MLDDADKARLREEEIYRDEVRRDLAAATPPATGAKRVWTVLNSAFCLWCLSSVVVASLTAAIAAHQKTHEEQTKAIDLRKRLATEITGRIAEAREGLMVDGKRVDSQVPLSRQWLYSSVAAYLNNSFIAARDDSHDFSIYPELRSRPFRSLLTELQSSVEPAGRPACAEADATFGRLAVVASLNEPADAPRPSADDARQAIAETTAIVVELERNSCLRPPK
ncbi:MAG TPA: hypothetical protein VK989_08185 [Polyangia bacterium]|nr:hypothetical protein [Polyangia bacterium]